MKTALLLLLTLTAVTPGGFAQTLLGPRFALTAEVFDTSGDPVEGAEVRIGYHVSGGGWSSEAPRFERVVGKTDENGEFRGSARTRSNWGVTVRVNKDGYYESVRSYDFDTVRLRRWRPWNPTLPILLKEKLDPIPMYAKRLWRETIPVKGEPVGYDLSKGDWVRPHGEGLTADIFFLSEGKRETRENRTRWDHTLTISFPNEGDGLVEFYQEENDYSELISNQMAPEDGYEGTRSWVNRRFPDPESPRYSKHEDDFDEDRHFYIRVRTELDSQGNVIQAHYGKIYNDIRFYPDDPWSGDSIVEFKYFLNPEANERGVEFDRDRNLLDLPRGMARPTKP